MIQEQTQQPATKPTPWAGFGYEPVRGLVDHHVARFLRTQRKNMRRFFQERGHLDLFAQLDELCKDPTRNFMSKNTGFQRILNEYIARTAPPVAEAASSMEPGNVVVPDAGADESSTDTLHSCGGRSDAGDNVPEVAQSDDAGIVIEE